MTTTKRCFAGSVVAMWLVSSCGGGGGGSSITVTEFCTQKATKECDGVAERCVVPKETCKAARMSVCLDFVEARQDAALRPFRVDKVAACVNKAGEIYKKTLITPTDTTALNDACEPVFSGKKKLKEACVSSNYECEAPLLCDQLLCVQKKNVGAGDFCNDPGATCPAGQYCAATGTQKTCTPQAKLSEACDATIPCIDTLRCGPAGKCAEKVTVGLACVQNSDCVTTSPYCDSYHNSTCNSGFSPSTDAKECSAFGGTAVTTGTGGASGSVGGSTGSAGGAGGA